MPSPERGKKSQPCDDFGSLFKAEEMSVETLR